MADVVFILGAGASRDSGAPLMRDFFDRAKDLLVDREPKLGSQRAAAFKAVFQTRRDLQALHSKTWLDLGNIEEVFALLEMRALLDPAPAHEQNIKNLETLIAATLEFTVRFHAASRDSYPESSEAYKRLRTLIENLRRKRRSAAILTFNYDLALEYSLRPLPTGNSKVFDYCLGPSSDEGVALLKLHGSLNWFRCPVCEQIIAVAARGDFNFEPSGNDYAAIKLPTTWPRHAAKNGASCQNEGGDLTAEAPILVPPTWNKHGRYRQVLPVWQRAVRELQGASDIVVIGYSLPPTDVFFNHLIALGTLDSEPLRSFVVVNCDQTGEVMARFRDRLGRGVPFRYCQKTFQEGIAEVSESILR